MEDAVRARIESILASGKVVLFMKGNRRAPACGFSSRTVDALDELLSDYVTVDVLADEAVREGLKEYSSWPTFPQLYVDGKLVGGADIVTDMAAAGELAAAVGVAGKLAVETPEVMLTEAAMDAFVRYAEITPAKVRLEIDRGFDAVLDLAPARPADLVLDLGRVVLAMDAATARRADGMTIDFVTQGSTEGFKIENPNAPPKVRALSVTALADMIAKKKPMLLLDVRTEDERDIVKLDGSVRFSSDDPEILDEVDRAMPIVLYCHHGVRSRAAAEHVIRLGFREVYNVTGGIDAWSREVDPSAPKY
ncbi:MAG: Grx4 family monothiol glutaredoxin [Sandaracinus sp.]